MYDINDIISMIIDHANQYHVPINRFDMQYILFVLNKVYKKIYGEYLFENTSTADPRNPKSYLTAFQKVNDRFAAYGGLDINSDISKNTNTYNIPVKVRHRIQYITDIMLTKKAEDHYYMKKLIDKHRKEELSDLQKINAYIKRELDI